MGKITDALKKIEKEREIQKQAWQNKPENQAAASDAQAAVIAQPSPAGDSRAKSQKAKPGKLTLEEKIKQLQERIKDRVFVARATDDSGLDPRAVTYFNPSAPVSEQYRILRTNILSKSLNKSVKTLLVTSALHGEGKTITALNLAIALAQGSDKKIFLADCDLRGGNIHKLLNIPLEPGLSNVLADGIASEITFQNSKIKNLTVLTRGKVPANPSELLSSLKMRRLLEELKSRFDYIILDAPPVISITDAGILGAQADGVMFAVQAQKTQERTIRQAQDLLEQARAKIVGFVLTQAAYYVPGYYAYYAHYQNKSLEN